MTPIRYNVWMHRNIVTSSYYTLYTIQLDDSLNLLFEDPFDYAWLLTNSFIYSLRFGSVKFVFVFDRCFICSGFIQTCGKTLQMRTMLHITHVQCSCEDVIQISNTRRGKCLVAVRCSHVSMITIIIIYNNGNKST